MKKKIKSLLLMTALISLFACDNQNISSSSSTSSSSASSSTSTSIIKEDEYEFNFNNDKIISLPAIKENQLSINALLSNVVAINFTYNTEENIKVKINFKEKNYLLKTNKVDNGYQFVFGEIDYLDMDKNINITILNNEKEVLRKEFNFKNYLLTIKDYQQNDLNYDNKKFVSYQTMISSFINFINNYRLMHSSNNLIDLTEGENKLLFNSLKENIYHVDWGKRDNLTIYGDEKEGFNWLNAEENDNSLKFNFTLDNEYKSLKAKIIINNEEEIIEPIKQENQYYFVTRKLSPLEYSYNISCTIYNEDTLISKYAEFSLNRAIAKVDIVGSDNEKLYSNSLYSYAKASAWYNEKNVVYSYLPPVNDNGLYTCEIDEYVYDDSRLLVNKSLSTFGTYLYINGVALDSNNTSFTSNEFDASYEDNKFKVVLKGGSIDGILVKENTPLEIIVEEDTLINGTLYRDWNDKNNKFSSSILVEGELNIVSKNNSKLTINGNIYTKKLYLNEANIEINSFVKNDGIVTLETLDINNSYLTIKNNLLENNNAGIKVNGNLKINNSNVIINNYDDGLYLNGEIEQTLIIDGEAKINIVAKSNGINSNIGNKDVFFNSGNTYIEGNTGINYCNVNVDNAYLKVVANNGYTIAHHDNLKQTFKTISEDYTLGEIHLVNNTPYNKWWDDNYTLCVEELLLNGGTLYLEGNSINGVIYTVNKTKMELKNCDVYIKNNNFGHGINAQSSDEELMIYNTSRLVIEHVDIAIGCWISESEETKPIYVTIQGDFAVDTYKGAIGEWDDKTKIIEGNVRYSNRVS